jgi:hypothetical protein
MPDVTFERSESITRPSDSVGDAAICAQCGTVIPWTPGHGRKPKWCEAHKTPASRGETSGSRGGGGTGKGRGKGKHNVTATEKQWNDFLGILLLSGTYIVGRYAAGGNGLMLDPPGYVDPELWEGYVEDLAMRSDEAKPIADLLAKRAVPSKLNKRAGWLVVNALELEEVGSALWAYGRRIGPLLSQRIAGNATPMMVQATAHRGFRAPVPPASRPTEHPMNVESEMDYGPAGQDQRIQGANDFIRAQRARQSTPSGPT